MLPAALSGVNPQLWSSVGSGDGRLGRPSLGEARRQNSRTVQLFRWKL